jgi:hypothetical protein
VNTLRGSSLALAACLTLSVAPDASAWGPDGHRIVWQIAFRLLDAPRQQEVIRLTAKYRRPQNGSGFSFFSEGCVFPDEARQKARDNVPGWDKFDPFDAWHFLNVPRTTHLVADSHCNNNCALTGITRHADLLRTSKTDEDRAEALFFLGHWVGDIHQPLHVSYSDDRGGNNITPIHGGFYESAHMHGVWDSGIIAKLVGPNGWRLFADRAARTITSRERHVDREPAGCVGAGVTQPDHATGCASLQLAPRVGHADLRSVPQERTLAQTYQEEFQGRVAQRLQPAGAARELLRRQLVLDPRSQCRAGFRHLFQRRLRRTGDDVAFRREPRAVAWTVPCALPVIPRDGAAFVGARCRAQHQRAFLVAVAAIFNCCGQRPRPASLD